MFWKAKIVKDNRPKSETFEHRVFWRAREATPSVDVARKIADLLNVSLDFLTGKVDEQIDKSIVDKVVSIQKLPKEERERIIFTLDALIRDARSRFAYA